MKNDANNVLVDQDGLYGDGPGAAVVTIEVDGVEKTFALGEFPGDEDVAKWARELVSYHLTDEDLEDVDLDRIDVSGVSKEAL